MYKKLLLIFLCLFLFVGCYDSNDIENIKSISLICVDDEFIHFISTSSIHGESKYKYELYTIKTNELNYGINILSEMTGKQISLSHLEAMIFSTDCNYKHIRQNINFLLNDTNTHPKVMTAFYSGDIKNITNIIYIPEYSSLNEFIDNILTNTHSNITKCSARELSCALNFDISGCCVPLIKVLDGNVIMQECLVVNNIGMEYIDETITTLISLINNKKDREYVSFEDQTILIELKKFKIYSNKSGLTIKLKVSEIKDKKLFEYFNSKIIDLYNKGFDVFKAGENLNKEFIDAKSKNEFISKFGDMQGWVRDLDVNIEVTE